MRSLALNEWLSEKNCCASATVMSGHRKSRGRDAYLNRQDLDFKRRRFAFFSGHIHSSKKYISIF